MQLGNEEASIRLVHSVFDGNAGAMRRPSFWYLACAFIFAALARPALTWLPGEIEKFRSPVLLLPVPLLMIKQSGWQLLLTAIALVILFVSSAFRSEPHSAMAVKIVSLGLLLILLFYAMAGIMSLLITVGP